MDAIEELLYFTVKIYDPIPSRCNSVQLKSVELCCFTEQKFGQGFSLVLQVF